MTNDNKETVEVDNRPTSQIDLERRLAEGFLPESARRDNTSDDVLNPEKVNAPYATEAHDTSAYRGVGQEYMQYANPTEKPIEATEGPEAESLKLLSGGVPNVRKSVVISNEPAKEVGVQGTETINTVSSGENYSAELVDAPVPQVTPFVAGAPDAEEQRRQSTPPPPAGKAAAVKSAPVTKPPAK